MNKLSQSYDVEVLVNSRPVKIYPHNNRLFVEAREGTEYTLKIRNGNWARKLAICSIDGINVVSGEPAGKNDTGYVIGAYQSYEIKGFRTSNDSVNAFKFSHKKDSYAAKSPQTDGDTSNCGVIGVRWYGEKSHPIQFPPYIPQPPILKRRIIEEEDLYPYRPILYASNTGTAPRHAEYSCSIEADSLVSSRSLRSANSVSCSATSFDMGTEFSGKEITDKVKDTSFEKDTLEEEIVIYYASRSVLQSWGVQLDGEVKVAFPSAFPSKFCKPPIK